MDLGVIFNQVVSLYKIWLGASFTIFGMAFTIGQVMLYGLFLTVVIAFINYLRS